MKFEIRLLGPTNVRYTMDHEVLFEAFEEIKRVGPSISGRYREINVPNGAKRVHITSFGLIFEK